MRRKSLRLAAAVVALASAAVCGCCSKSIAGDSVDVRVRVRGERTTLRDRIQERRAGRAAVYVVQPKDAPPAGAPARTAGVEQLPPPAAEPKPRPKVAVTVEK